MATSSPPSVLDGYSLQQQQQQEEEEIVVGKKKALMEDQKIVRRKYSAIRNYPPGCGRFTLKLQQRSDNYSETCDDKKLPVLEERMVGKRKADNLMEGGGDEIVHKRRKYSAVRDYPPGVGPNQHIIANFQDSESCGCDDTESSVLDGCCSKNDDYDYDEEEEVEVVEEEWEEEEALVREMKELEEEEEEEEEARMVIRKREGLLMEEGGANEIVGKTRKYFAVRDYPPGVGPNQYQYITSNSQHSGSCGADDTKLSVLYGCCCEDDDYDEEEEARLVEEEEARVVEEEWKRLEEEKEALDREMKEEEEEEVCMYKEEG